MDGGNWELAPGRSFARGSLVSEGVPTSLASAKLRAERKLRPDIEMASRWRGGLWEAKDSQRRMEADGALRLYTLGARH